MNQFTLEGQTSQDSNPNLLLGNACILNYHETSNEINSTKIINERPGSLLNEVEVVTSQNQEVKPIDAFGKRRINPILIKARQIRLSRKLSRCEFGKSCEVERDTRWKSQRALQSDIQHLEYDFTRGYPPVLVSPVQKKEQDELETQFGSMSVSQPTVRTQSEIKKIRLERLRRMREDFKLKTQS